MPKRGLAHPSWPDCASLLILSCPHSPQPSALGQSHSPASVIPTSRLGPAETARVSVQAFCVCLIKSRPRNTQHHIWGRCDRKTRRPKDTEIFCKDISPRNDREATPIKCRPHGYLNKASNKDNVSRYANTEIRILTGPHH